MFQYNFRVLFLLCIFAPLLCTEKILYNPPINNSIHLTLDTSISHQATNHYGIRASQHDHYNRYARSYGYDHYSADEFQQLFQKASSEYDILSNYEFYAFQNFCTYARTLSCYQKFMLSLQEKINHDKNFRKQTACVRGFHYSFSWGTEKSGFHDFVRDEICKLQAQQKKSNNRQGGLCLDDQSLDVVIKDCITRLQANGENHRLERRIKAIDDTRRQQGKCFDYSFQVSCFNVDDSYSKEFSNTYGTQLDCQLHKELYDSRNLMLRLERTFLYNQHIQAIAPFVHYYATQAKMEKNPLTAFTLSDFCYVITHVLAHGLHVLYDGSCAIGKGVWKGAKEFVNTERWREMATGSLHLGLLFVDAIGQIDELNNAADVALFFNDPDVMHLAEKKYYFPAQERINAIQQSSQQTYQKMRVMPWQELIENGTEIGTTMILDTLALHALSGFTRTASGSLVKHLNSAMESGALLSEQYAVEVAGFGKLMVEEGAAVSAKVSVDAIKNDLMLFAKSTEPISQQIKNKVTQVKWSENVVQKIRNVGDDILDVMEKAGGHTLEKHVGKTYEDLFLRAMQYTGDTMTSFTNKKAAINAVKENLKYNAREIASWLATNPAQNIKKSFGFLHSYDIGKGILKGKKNGLTKLRMSKIVLISNSNNEFGFEILTAFPTSI